MTDSVKLLKYCQDYLDLAEGGLEKDAAKKKKKEKLDPKAKVRNRGDVIFPAESSLDHKDHFEINNIGQARNALARSMQYSSNPKWHKGSLKTLQETVRRKVHSKYPSIEIGDKKKKSALIDVADIVEKYGEEHHKRCNCEQSKCEKEGKHEAGDCKRKAGDKKAMYIGSICDECAKTMPKEYMKED